MSWPASPSARLRPPVGGHLTPAEATAATAAGPQRRVGGGVGQVEQVSCQGNQWGVKASEGDGIEVFCAYTLEVEVVEVEVEMLSGFLLHGVLCSFHWCLCS